MKKILVDIDNTLWNFSDELYLQLKRKFPSFSQPSEWNGWDFWRGQCEEADYWGAVNAIHFNQDKYIPFAESKKFLQALKKSGFYILIMSYRLPASLEVTRKWLNENELIFDEIQFPKEKADLFGKDCCLVIDDEPRVLQKAQEKGIATAGLRTYPNREGQNECNLFTDLDGVLAYVESFK